MAFPTMTSLANKALSMPNAEGVNPLQAVQNAAEHMARMAAMIESIDGTLKRLEKVLDTLIGIIIEIDERNNGGIDE